METGRITKKFNNINKEGQGRPNIVMYSRQEGSNAVTFSTYYDNRVGCFQHRVGSSTRKATDRWKMVPIRIISPHKLSRTASCLSSTTVLCQAQKWDYHSNEVGQYHSSDTYLSVTVSASTDIWDWCILRGVFLVAENLPGKNNITADQES